MKLVRTFWNDENSRDLTRYALLMAFAALASAATLLSAGGSISDIWSTSNSQLSALMAV